MGAGLVPVVPVPAGLRKPLVLGADLVAERLALVRERIAQAGGALARSPSWR